MNIFKYVVASSFFADYCPNVKNFKVKLSGTHSSGYVAKFSEQDKKKILRGIKKQSKDLIKEAEKELLKK